LDYNIQKELVKKYEDDLKRTETLMTKLKMSTLPDGGEKLHKQRNQLAADLRDLKERLRNTGPVKGKS